MPELGRGTPLATCLAETRVAGYAGTVLGGKFPRESKELRAVLDKRGLALVSGWYDGRMLDRDVGAELDAVLPQLKLVRDLGQGRSSLQDATIGRSLVAQMKSPMGLTVETLPSTLPR